MEKKKKFLSTIRSNVCRCSPFVIIHEGIICGSIRFNKGYKQVNNVSEMNTEIKLVRHVTDSNHHRLDHEEVVQYLEKKNEQTTFFR